MLLTLAILACTCLAGILLERSRWLGYVPAPVTVILMGAALSASGILPRESGVYTIIYQSVVPISIALLLMHANLRGLGHEVGKLVFVFLLAVVATLAASLIAYAIFSGTENAIALVTIFMATYIGGTVNFLAAGQMFDVAEADFFVSAFAADSIVGVSYLLILSLVSVFVRKSDGKVVSQSGDTAVVRGDVAGLPFQVSILASLTFALVAVITANLLVQATAQEGLFYMFLTTIVVAAANILPIQLGRLKEAPQLGLMGIYFFFAMIGAATDLGAVQSSISLTLSIAALIVSVHVLFFFGIGLLLRINFPTLIILSNACILGPPTAAALAASRGWSHLVAPGLLCGVLGYVIANFFAAFVAHAVM